MKQTLENIFFSIIGFLSLSMFLIVGIVLLINLFTFQIVDSIIQLLFVYLFYKFGNYCYHKTSFFKKEKKEIK